jgi:hypothetical protein
VVADSEDAVCQKEFTLVIDPNIFSTIPWVFTNLPIGNGSASSSGGGESILLFAQDPGGSCVPSGGTSQGNCVWNAWNPTPNTINCSVTIRMTRVNGAPPAAEGVQWFFFGGYLWQRIDGGIIVYANSIGTVGEGTWGPFTFPVPPGASTWQGAFGHGVSSSGGPCPPNIFIGGSGTMIVTLDIIT